MANEIPRMKDKTGSPLTEGRGLKFCNSHSVRTVVVVAPHGGAWIEITPALRLRSSLAWSPLTEGRGLK